MRKKIFIALLCLVLLGIAVFAVVLAINLHVISTARKSIYAPDETSNLKADCILVLGAGLKPDNTPSDMLKDRLDCAYGLWENGVAQKLIVSGDHGRTNYDEVNAMKKYLVQRGIPQDSILLDHAGFSTYDSIYRAKAVFCADSTVIVTQKYHLYRALYCAQALGLNAMGVNSDQHTYRGQPKRELRECAARVKDFFTAVIKPLPKYLGEPIPVLSSPGSVTDDTK